MTVAALVALTAALCSTSLVNSTVFNGNPGPQLVASASLVPSPIAALSY